MKVALAAGEASGDNLGAGLIHALRARTPEVRCFGVAGPRMVAAGCEAWASSDELAVMGLAEILRHLPRLLRGEPPGRDESVLLPRERVPLSASHVWGGLRSRVRSG